MRPFQASGHTYIYINTHLHSFPNFQLFNVVLILTSISYARWLRCLGRRREVHPDEHQGLQRSQAVPHIEVSIGLLLMLFVGQYYSIFHCQK